MDEEDVIIHVLKWLEKAYASSSNIKVCRGSPNAGPDVYVESFSSVPVNPEKDTYTIHMIVECKGSDSELDRALGQSLGYHVDYGQVPTYLAIPRSHFRFNYLKKVIEKLDLPLGLLQVDENGEVYKVREAKGELVTIKIMEDGDKLVA